MTGSHQTGLRIRLATACVAVLLVAIALAYALATRSVVLDSVHQETEPLLTDKAQRYEGLVRSVRGWSEVIQSRWYLLTGAPQDTRRRADLAALLVDLTRAADGLTQVVIVNTDGWILYSSDGAPGPIAESAQLILPPGLLESDAPYAVGIVSGRTGSIAGRERFFFWKRLSGNGGIIDGAVGFAIAPRIIDEMLALHGRLHRSFHLASSATGDWSGPAPVRISGLGPLTQVDWRTPGDAPERTGVAAHRLVDMAGQDTVIEVIDMHDLLDHDWWRMLWPATVMLAVLLLVLLVAGWLIARAVERAQIRSREALVARRWTEGIFRAASDAMIVVDRDQNIVYVNPAAESMFGYRPEELVGRPLSRLLPHSSHARHARLVRDTLSGRHAVPRMGDFRQVRGLRADGETFPLAASIGVVDTDHETFAVAIVRDMSEVEKANQRLTALTTELSLQLEMAQQANKAKSDFLAQMSHELRTPLNAVIGFNEILEQDMFGKGIADIYREYAHDARVSGQHLLGILNDILDLSRVEADRVDLDMDKVPVADIWELPVRNLHMVGRARGATIDFTPPVEGLAAFADRRAARQCVFNVLHNAIKFSPEGGRVTCRTEDRGEMIDLVVSDTGRGMHADDIPRLLRAFEQAGEAMIAERQGTGLGLTIADRLMSAMGGQLLIDSAPGKGTTVRLRFRHGATDPIRKVMSPVAADADG